MPGSKDLLIQECLWHSCFSPPTEAVVTSHLMYNTKANLGYCILDSLFIAFYLLFYLFFRCFKAVIYGDHTGRTIFHF